MTKERVKVKTLRRLLLLQAVLAVFVLAFAVPAAADYACSSSCSDGGSGSLCKSSDVSGQVFGDGETTCTYDSCSSCQYGCNGGSCNPVPCSPSCSAPFCGQADGCGGKCSAVDVGVGCPYGGNCGGTDKCGQLCGTLKIGTPGECGTALPPPPAPVAPSCSGLGDYCGPGGSSCCSGFVCGDGDTCKEAAYCGNSVCESGESCSSCQVDCGKCCSPVAGGWSGWGVCSKSCGGGTQSRVCSNPYPYCGGAGCVGLSSQACNVQPCAVSCVAEGGDCEAAACCSDLSCVSSADGTVNVCKPSAKVCTSAAWSCSGFPKECPASGVMTQTCTLVDFSCTAPDNAKPVTSKSCAPPVKEVCGGDGQKCCSGNTCSSGLVCDALPVGGVSVGGVCKAPVSKCLDLDGDLFGKDCDNGADCDDINPAKWRMLDGFVDADGDGFGAGLVVSVCSGSFLPSGYSLRGGDCNDADAKLSVDCKAAVPSAVPVISAVSVVNLGSTASVDGFMSLISGKLVWGVGWLTGRVAVLPGSKLSASGGVADAYELSFALNPMPAKEYRLQLQYRPKGSVEWSNFGKVVSVGELEKFVSGGTAKFSIKPVQFISVQTTTASVYEFRLIGSSSVPTSASFESESRPYVELSLKGAGGLIVPAAPACGSGCGAVLCKPNEACIDNGCVYSAECGAPDVVIEKQSSSLAAVEPFVSLPCKGQQPCFSLSKGSFYCGGWEECQFSDGGGLYKGTLADVLLFSLAFAGDMDYSTSEYSTVLQFRKSTVFRKEEAEGWSACREISMGGSKAAYWKINARECVRELAAYDFRIAGYKVSEGDDAPAYDSPVFESNLITVAFMAEADKTPPVVRFNPVRPAGATDKDKIEISAWASDDLGASRMVIYVDGNSDGIYEVEFACPSHQCVWAGGPYPAGKISYYASAWDYAGNEGRSSLAEASILRTCTPLVPRCGSVGTGSFTLEWNPIEGAHYFTKLCPAGAPLASSYCFDDIQTSKAAIEYSGLTGGTSYDAYIDFSIPSSSANACVKSGGWSVPVTCTTYPSPDMPPPVRSNGKPTGSLRVGAAETKLYMKTNEPAKCKYDTEPGKDYNSMSHGFVSNGRLSSVPTWPYLQEHITPVKGLTPGAYTYYVKCVNNRGIANTDDYVISFKVPAFDAKQALTCPQGQVSSNDGLECIGVMDLIGYPSDTVCTTGWPGGQGGALDFGPEVGYSCDLFEVKDSRLLEIAKEAATCFTAQCGDSSCHSKCVEVYKMSGADIQQDADTFKRFAGYYLIYGLGPAAKFMKGYLRPEVNCGEGNGYCGPKEGFNSYVQQLECKGPVGNPRGWASDDDMRLNSCLLSILPAHASIVYLNTGTCADYSVSATTLLRYAGYRSNEVMSVHLSCHMFSYVKFPGSEKWSIVDTVANNPAPIDSPWQWNCGSYTGFYGGNVLDSHCDYHRVLKCVNDNGKVPCPPQEEIGVC